MRITLPLLFFFCVVAALNSCGDKAVHNGEERAENLYEDSISTSYTMAMPDRKGEGLRITYTFFNMKRADTGNFKMTHIYMRHTGEEDTSVVNGTWKRISGDSGNFIHLYSGRTWRVLQFANDESVLSTFNTDTLLADTGMLYFREKADNDIRNSTVKVVGRIYMTDDKNMRFIDESGDTLPVMKISAYRDLLAWNDSVNVKASGERVSLMGTIQIRMAMDGKSTQRSLIVEKVLGTVRE